MNGEDDHRYCLGDVDKLDHLENLVALIRWEDDQDDQGSHHSHGTKLDHLPLLRG
jgi:hypothetical protein